jgi:hypothetical protein
MTTRRFAVSLTILAIGAAALSIRSADALTSSAALILCQKKIEVHARALTKYAAKKVHLCTEKVAACKLANEIDAADLMSCLATTANVCNATDGLIDNQRTIRGGKVLTACATIPFADLQPYIGGLGFLSVPMGCTPANATDLANCLMDTARCAGERQVIRLDPRAQDSLTAAGVAASFPCVAP